MKWLRRWWRTPRFHRLLDELTDALERGDDEVAARIAERCVELAESIYGPRDSALVGPLYALASAMLVLGRHADAADACERALSIVTAFSSKRIVEPCEPPLHRIWEQRAAIADRAGDEEVFRHALGEMSTVAGADAAVRATAHNRLGLSWGREARFQEAAEHFDKALVLREQLDGAALTVAEVLHNVATFRDPGSATHSEGDLRHSRDQAAAAFARALTIVGTHLTPAASELEARIAHNFAVLRQEQLRDDEAESLYRRSLAALSREREATHPSQRPTLVRLARLLQAKRRFAEAAVLLERARAIAVVELGAEHEVTLTIGTWLGDANSETYR